MRSTVRKILTTTALVLCGTLGLQVSAQASVFNFTYTGVNSTEIANGTLTTGAAESSGNTLLITSITGTYNGAAITGLLPVNTFYKTSGLFGLPGNDNALYYPTTQIYLGVPTYLDRSGFGFSTTSSAFVNIFFGLGGYGDLYSNSASSATSENIGSVFSVTPVAGAVPVPEPAALGMFGLGMLLIGGFVGLRRRAA